MKIPWRRNWQPTPVFLLGEFHGQESLADYSPWGHKELDTTQQLTHTHTQTHTHYNGVGETVELGKENLICWMEGGNGGASKMWWSLSPHWCDIWAKICRRWKREPHEYLEHTYGCHLGVCSFMQPLDSQLIYSTSHSVRELSWNQPLSLIFDVKAQSTIWPIFPLGKATINHQFCWWIHCLCLFTVGVCKENIVA